MNIASEQEMMKLGREMAAMCSTEHEDLARAARSVSGGHAAGISLPIIIELLGDVGAGKTTFVRGFAEGLGIKENITSPSFTISKTYAIPDGRTLIHYDFYRLPDPGLMAEDLEENLNNPNNIVIVEWADSVANLLPKNHKKIEIKYNEDGSREVIL
jgi:tRNA threonylcarbamoyladenosine biosynthesis protein TsaE